MNLSELSCPECQSTDYRLHETYSLQSGEKREQYRCGDCGTYFSETANTPMAGLRTPLSKIILVLTSLNEGIGINAAARLFQVSKNSIYGWLERMAALKEVLMLYALCHHFLQTVIEGDEFYTRVYENRPPAESEGWTIALMERASRFLWELQCGERDETLFANAIQTLAQIIAQTNDLTLVTDGERRYGNLLFAICRQTLRTGKPGRPKTTLPQGVKVRLKNKGSQSHRPGPKRPKYQAPIPEHPKTPQDFADAQIHANHLEAFAASIRRRLACYRRQTNTYAKAQPALQRRLDVYWVFHNFVKVHFTTKKVPAVALGILDAPLSWLQLFSIQLFTFN